MDGFTARENIKHFTDRNWPESDPKGAWAFAKAACRGRRRTGAKFRISGGYRAAISPMAIIALIDSKRSLRSWNATAITDCQGFAGLDVRNAAPAQQPPSARKLGSKSDRKGIAGNWHFAIGRDASQPSRPHHPRRISSTEGEASERHTKARTAASAPASPTTPPGTATPATASTAVASTAVASAASASTAPVAAPVCARFGELHTAITGAGAFLVVDVKGRQGDVPEFLLTEAYDRCGALRRYILCWIQDCGGSAARR